MDDRSTPPHDTDAPGPQPEATRPSTGDGHTASDDGADPRTPQKPQSPASMGLRAGLFMALAAALLVLATNDSFLLPSMDEDGVAHLYAAASEARGEGLRVPVAHWSAPDTTSALVGPVVVPKAMAALISRGTRVHVAALWFLAGSLALLVLTVAWVAGGAAGMEGGFLAGALVLVSALAVEAGTALRPEALAAALVGLQMGLMTYRPRWHLAHGAAGALVWVVHPAGAGAVAAATLWPLLPDTPPLGPGLAPEAVGRGRGARFTEAGLALVPASVLLLLGPAVAGLPTLPPVVDGGPSAAPLVQLLEWAAAGIAGTPGIVIGLVALAGMAFLVLVEALSTEPVDPSVPWHHPRTPDLVATRARAAGWTVALGVALGAVVAGGSAGLERAGLLVVAPVAILAGLAARRWIQRAPGRTGWVLAGVVGLWLGVSGWNALERSREIRAYGRGFTSEAWLESPAIRWLDNEAPRGLEVYASAPHLVLIQTLEAARSLPSDDASMPEFVERFASHPGVVVLAGSDTTRAGTFEAALGLVTVIRATEGWILAPPLPGDPPEAEPAAVPGGG